MKDDTQTPLSLDTMVLHCDDADSDGAVAPPIYQTANFWATDGEQFEEMAGGDRSSSLYSRFYTRYGNPTLARAAKVLAALEGAEDALLFPTGMAAISAVFFTFLKSGDHVVCQKHVYAGTNAQLLEIERQFGIDVTFVDQRDLHAFDEAIGERTRLVVLESPSHPLMDITDISAVAALARERGALSVIHNTAATPVNQRPLNLGVDLVMHSATKSLAGHSDIVAGAVAGSRELVKRLHERNILMGSTISPHDAWLLLRGMRTLVLRVERQNENGLRVAGALEKDPRVVRVHYPGLDSHPQHELAKRQMSGFTGVIGIEVRGGYEGADAFIGALKRVRRAASIGAVQSLGVHPAAMWRGVLAPEAIAKRGLSEALVRLSLGIDAAEDILQDMMQALDSIPAVHA